MYTIETVSTVWLSSCIGNEVSFNSPILCPCLSKKAKHNALYMLLVWSEGYVSFVHPVTKACNPFDCIVNMFFLQVRCAMLATS